MKSAKKLKNSLQNFRISNFLGGFLALQFLKLSFGLNIKIEPSTANVFTNWFSAAVMKQQLGLGLTLAAIAAAFCFVGGDAAPSAQPASYAPPAPVYYIPRKDSSERYLDAAPESLSPSIPWPEWLPQNPAAYAPPKFSSQATVFQVPPQQAYQGTDAIMFLLTIICMSLYRPYSYKIYKHYRVTAVKLFKGCRKLEENSLVNTLVSAHSQVYYI